MTLLFGFIHFCSIFILIMSILCILKVIFEIVKVYTLQEGKVEMDGNEKLLIAASISYIISFICC